MQKENEERFLENEKYIFNKIESNRNIWFSLIFVLLNVCSVFVIWAVATNNIGCMEVNEFLKMLNWNYIYLILGIIIIALLLKTILNYIFLYVKNKQRRFLSLFNIEIKNNYHNLTVMYSRGTSVCSTLLNESGVEKIKATECSYGIKLFDKIAFTLISIIVFIFGLIFSFDKRLILFILTGFGVILANCIVLMCILFSAKNKEKIVAKISKFSMFLFKLKLINDFERYYKNTITSLTKYLMSLKTNKLLLALQILGRVIIVLLRYVLVFVTLSIFVHSTWQLFVDAIFIANILDLILQIVPLRRGDIFKNLLLVVLLNLIIDSTFVLWAMLLLFIFEYVIHVVIYFISKLFYLICKKTNNKAKI